MTVFRYGLRFCQTFDAGRWPGLRWARPYGPSAAHFNWSVVSCQLSVVSCVIASAGLAAIKCGDRRPAPRANAERADARGLSLSPEVGASS
jgi:hypothetical protein